MEIYVPHYERTALSAIDMAELNALLDKAIEDERSGCLNKLNLSSCGSHVGGRLHAFERALLSYRQAKSARKRDEAGTYLQSVKHELSFSVRAMQQRVKQEEQDEQFFFVQGESMPPYGFGERLTAKVRFRWRRSIEDDWSASSITFVHNVDPFARRLLLAPKRKLSARKQEEEYQEQLSDTWEYLMTGALYSVRDYFRQGGDGGTIPEIFDAKPGSAGHLNNNSTVFWTKNT